MARECCSTARRHSSVSITSAAKAETVSWIYVVTTEPTSEPVTLDELKDSMRITGCDFDTDLTQLLTHCRKQAEQDSMRKFITQTVTLYMDEFPEEDEIELRLMPISAVSSVKYYDTNGTLQTFSSSSYWTNLIEAPPEICLKSGYSWPLTQLERPNAIEIALTCGYGARSAVHVAAKLAIKELASHIWNNCGGTCTKYRDLISMISWTGYMQEQA